MKNCAWRNHNGCGAVNVTSQAMADYNCVVEMTVYNADGSVYASSTDTIASYVSRITDAKLLVLGQELAKFAESARAYFVK